MLRYFIPERKIGIDQATPALWADLGLSHAATAWPVLNVLQSEGPSGAHGTVVVFHDADKPAGRAEVGYFPEKQDWVKCAGGKYWCGKGKGERINPESLRRADGAPGIRVQLGDGQEWEIARAVYEDGRRMTRKLALDDDGNVVKGEVIERYRALDVAASKFFDVFIAAKDEGVPAEYMLDDLTDLAVLGLAVNYRISKDEAMRALQLFDEDNVWRACEATISWQVVLEMWLAQQNAEKKTDEAATPSG